MSKERSSEEVQVELARLGDKLSRLRLCDPADVAIVQRSLEHQGQLSAVLVFDDAGQLEVIDGFKRLGAARNLGWSALRVRVASDCGELDLIRKALAKQLARKRPVPGNLQGFHVDQEAHEICAGCASTLRPREPA